MLRAMEKITLHSSASEVIADPHPLLRAIREAVPDFDAAAAAALAEAAAEEEMLGDMASFRKNVTGVDNTIFISTKEGVPHGPRIKVAVDPPDSLSARGKNATVTFGGDVIGDMPAKIIRQARAFIDLNRDVLLEYWDCRIDTDELRQGLKKIS